METEVKTKPAAAAEPAAAEPPEMCIIDLGRQERSRIRKLRHGHGRLMRQVVEATEALQEEGVLAENAQIVVVLVREAPSLAGLIDGIRSDDDDDDEDDD